MSYIYLDINSILSLLHRIFNGVLDHKSIIFNCSFIFESKIKKY